MESNVETYDRVERSLTNVTPSGDSIAWIEHIRNDAKVLAQSIIFHSPSSRERSLALTHLEETVMWAVKGIVLNGGTDDDGTDGS